MPIDARTSGGVYKVVSKILTADGSEIGKVMDSTGRIIYEASRLITVTGVPPISFTKSIGKPLVSWDLLGNAQQTGTPTPDAPIMPAFCGVRTGNLAKYWKAAYITVSGEVNSNRVNGMSFPVKIEAGQTVIFTNQKTNFGRGIAVFSGFDGVTLTDMIYRSTRRTDTYSANSDCYVVIWGNYDNATSMDESVFALCGQMLNLGSTALPYEPYGYKIPFGIHGDNLFDATTLENGIYLAASGNKYGDATNGVRAGTKIKVLPNTAYTLSAQSSANVSLRIFEWSNGTFIRQTPKYNISGSVSLTVTTDAETTEITFNIEGENGQYATNIMLNTGSTALPYSPYFSETVPVYLGQTQTVRRIRKLVLTGEEVWLLWNGNYYSSVIDRKGAISTILCTHFINSSVQGISYNGQSTSGLKIASVAVPFVSSVNDLKAWLAAQYAAGTPVTVWYVLAEPETAIVNEPICKIGDYADELHSTDAAVTIPTAKGNNTLTVDTDLLPSSMTIVYKGR